MRQLLHNNLSSANLTSYSLQGIINNLVGNLIQDNPGNRCEIFNEVTSDITLLAEESRIAPVLEELLSTVVSNAHNGRIHISAERFRDIITIEIEERNTNNSYALSYSIKALEPIARLAGGYIAIKGQQRLKTTISFSFPNQPGNFTYDC